MPETEVVNSFVTAVACAGGEVPYDHPLVYLEIDPEQGSICCPYCGKKFVLQHPA